MRRFLLPIRANFVVFTWLLILSIARHVSASGQATEIVILPASARCQAFYSSVSTDYLAVALEPVQKTPYETRLTLFSRDADGVEQVCASGCHSGTRPLHLWVPPDESRTGLRALLVSDNTTESVEFVLTVSGPDNRAPRMAVLSATQVSLIDRVDGDILRSIELEETAKVRFTPDGSRLLVRGDSTAFYNAETGAAISETGGTSADFDPVFVPGQKQVFLADDSPQLSKLFSTVDGNLLMTIPGAHVSLGPENDRAIVTGATGSILLDLHTPSIVEEYDTNSVVLSHNGSIAALWNDGSITQPFFAESQTGQSLPQSPGQFARVDSIRFDPSGQYCLVRGQRPQSDLFAAVLCSATSGETIVEFPGASPWEAEFAPFGERLLLVQPGTGGSGLLMLVDCKSGQTLRIYRSLTDLLDVRFHPCFSRILVAGTFQRDQLQNEVKLLEATSGSQIQQYTPLEFKSFQFSPADDRFVLNGVWSYENRPREELQLYDSDSGERLGGSSSSSQALEWHHFGFSPDSRYLFGHSRGQPYWRSVIWRTSDGSIVTDDNVFTGEIESFGFSFQAQTCYYYAQWTSWPRIVRIVDLESGDRIGNDLAMKDTGCAPVLSPARVNLALIGKPQEEDAFQLLLIDLRTAAVKSLDIPFNFETCGLNWTADGEDVLCWFLDSQGAKHLLLVDGETASLKMQFENEADILLDRTVPPVFGTGDLDFDSRLDYRDAFLIQKHLDPQYPGYLYPFLLKSR